MEQGPHFFRHVPGEQNGHGDGDDKHQHQHRGDGHHHDEGAHHRDDAGGDLQQIVGEGGVYRVDVVGDAADDITGLMTIERSIKALISTEDPSDTRQQPEQIVHNVNDLLDNLIEQSVALIGKPAALMNKEEKVTAIQFLNDAGAFLITKSGDKVSKYFGISKFTLYSYIDVNSRKSS